LLQRDKTILQDPYRNICGKFGDLAYNASEEVENVKSLQYGRKTDGCRIYFNQKSSAETTADN